MEREKCIFDMDGTLVDSMRYWRRLERDFLTQRGVSIPDMERVLELAKHRLTRAHREKQLKMSCQALHNAPPNRT